MLEYFKRRCSAVYYTVLLWSRSVNSHQKLCDPAVFSSFFRLHTGLWEASRRAFEPSWIYELPTCLQHGTIPRVSACSCLPCYFPASAPLHSAPLQRAHVLQHELPHPRPSSSIHFPKGAICVTCHVTIISARGNMIVPQMLREKQSSAEQMCIYPHLASVSSIGLKHLWASPCHMKVSLNPLCIVCCLLHWSYRAPVILWC